MSKVSLKEITKIARGAKLGMDVTIFQRAINRMWTERFPGAALPSLRLGDNNKFYLKFDNCKETCIHGKFNKNKFEDSIIKIYSNQLKKIASLKFYKVPTETLWVAHSAEGIYQIRPTDGVSNNSDTKFFAKFENGIHGKDLSMSSWTAENGAVRDPVSFEQAEKLCTKHYMSLCRAKEIS